MRSLLSALLFCFVSQLAFANTITHYVKRGDGSQITVYVDYPTGTATFPLVLHVHGSHCGTRYPEHQQLVATFPKSIRAAIVTSEKRGINASTVECPSEFVRKYSFKERIADQLKILNAMANHKKWNGEVILYGMSEGSYASSILASRIPKLKAAVLFAGGTAWSLGNSVRSVVGKGIFSCEDVDDVYKLELKFKEIRRNPTYSKSFCDPNMTYKWWNSVMNVEPLPSLVKVTAPIYAAHGTLDTLIDIEGVIALDNKFFELKKTNLTTKLYEGYGHGFHTFENGQLISHWEEVQAEAHAWLEKVIL